MIFMANYQQHPLNSSELDTVEGGAETGCQDELEPLTEFADKFKVPVQDITATPEIQPLRKQSETSQTRCNRI